MMHPLTLCLVTQTPPTLSDAYLAFILEAVKGGVTSVQLRDKHTNPAQLYHFALSLKTELASHNIPLIINDHLELALAIDADGVHLGQSDYSPIDARRLLGSDKLIGLSIETLEELDVANTLSCINYVAASAVFNSTTKTNCKTIWGIKGLKTITARSIHPVVAIGGITLEHIPELMHAGAQGIAVISALHGTQNPALAATQLIHAIKGHAYV